MLPWFFHVFPRFLLGQPIPWAHPKPGQATHLPQIVTDLLARELLEAQGLLHPWDVRRHLLTQRHGELGWNAWRRWIFGFFSSITRQVTKIFPRISKELVAFMFCRCIKVIKLQMMQNDFACLPSFPLCNTLPSLSFQAMQLLPCNLSMAIRHWLSPMSAIIAAFQGL